MAKHFNKLLFVGTLFIFLQTNQTGDMPDSKFYYLGANESPHGHHKSNSSCFAFVWASGNSTYSVKCTKTIALNRLM